MILHKDTEDVSIRNTDPEYAEWRAAFLCLCIRKAQKEELPFLQIPDDSASIALTLPVPAQS